MSTIHKTRNIGKNLIYGEISDTVAKSVEASAAILAKPAEGGA
jgi:hypothetical protein